jgi:hypothetical protein
VTGLPIKCDGVEKTTYHQLFVIPAQAGIQNIQKLLDSRLRGNDSKKQFAGFYEIARFGVVKLLRNEFS